MESVNIKGVIFDFDGVIVDSENSWPAVENPYIQQHTTDWSDDFYADLIGMGKYFESITSSYDEDVHHGKPEPDVYLKALQKQELALDEAIAVEDSQNGIAVATSAGLFCVGVNINSANLKINSYDEFLQLFR